jgi:excisionase family DNA binding protein
MPSPPDPLQLLTIKQVAGLVQMSKSWVEQQVTAGNLVPHRPGRCVRFSRADVAAFQASLRNAPRPVELAAVVEMRRAS